MNSQRSFHKKSAAFPPHSCGGNALFLILIAVALFAALSYAVTKSGRGGGTIDKEQAALIAAQVISTANVLAQGVQRLNLTGLPYAEMEAGPPGGATEPGTGSLNGYVDFCTTGSQCIFSPTGGGLDLPHFPRAAFLDVPDAPVSTWYPNYFQGAGSFNGYTIYGFSLPNVTPHYGIQGAGTPAADDMLTVYPLKQDVCEAINKGLGISGIPAHDGGATITSLPAGQTAGCVDFLGGGEFYNFVMVLAAH